MLRTALLALGTLCALPAAAQETPAAPSAAAPGDVIRLVVWRGPEFSGDFVISPEGTILHPLLSEVRVAGASPAQVRAQIDRVLRQYDSDPRFVFSLLHRVAVTGEVRLPGLYPLPAETTIPQALAAAGGTSQFAAAGRVRLVRGGQATLLDLRRPEALTMDLRIQPGDRLEVPRQPNLLRDVVVPVASVVAGVGAVVTIVRN